VGSRNVLLAWSSNYDMKDFAETHPIDKFLMQFKDSTQSWNDKNSEQIIPGDQNTVLIDYLKPASNYHFRIFAENHLGTSAPSDILHIRTNDEAPSSAPRNVAVKALGAQELLVTWRAPERETWNGDLHGYAIGYCREHSGEKQYNFTKIGTAGDEGLNEFRITNLDKFTAYAVVIKAFNGQGDGPNSAPVITTTLEDGKL
jgi:Down syndrome cell adhesion molecule